MFVTAIATVAIAGYLYPVFGLGWDSATMLIAFIGASMVSGMNFIW